MFIENETTEAGIIFPSRLKLVAFTLNTLLTVNLLSDLKDDSGLKKKQKKNCCRQEMSKKTQ